jgi:hypothetical protein
MSTVLEEKMPTIRNYFVERYGSQSESAVDAVEQGLKTAISLGIASNNQEGNFEIQSLGGPDTVDGSLGPLIGTKISEAAGVPSPEQVFPNQFKDMEKAQNAELTAFAKNVFGQNGSLQSLQERGIIINGQPVQAETIGIWVQSGLQDSAAAQGIIIHGRQNPTESVRFQEPLAATGVVGPEYTTLKAMDETLNKTLKLQQEFQRFNLPLKA